MPPIGQWWDRFILSILGEYDADALENDHLPLNNGIFGPALDDDHLPLNNGIFGPVLMMQMQVEAQSIDSQKSSVPSTPPTSLVSLNKRSLACPRIDSLPSKCSRHGAAALPVPPPLSPAPFPPPPSPRPLSPHHSPSASYHLPAEPEGQIECDYYHKTFMEEEKEPLIRGRGEGIDGMEYDVGDAMAAWDSKPLGMCRRHNRFRSYSLAIAANISQDAADRVAAACAHAAAEALGARAEADA